MILPLCCALENKKTEIYSKVNIFTLIANLFIFLMCVFEFKLKNLSLNPRILYKDEHSRIILKIVGVFIDFQL